MKKDQTKKISSKDLDNFLKRLESDAGQIRLKEFLNIDKSGNTNVNFKLVAKDLVQKNIHQFSTLFAAYEDGVTKRRIERVYSRKEIQKMVCDHLIAEYQHADIIGAVTDYLYSVHVAQ